MVNSIKTTEKSSLIQILTARQIKEGLNNTQFASKLQIPRTVWVQAKYGDRPIAWTLSCAILRTYPELTDDVISYMRDGDNEPQ